MTRSCGECGVCCVYFPYKNIKPCPHLRQPLGTDNCLVHNTSKPAGCQAFQCGWLQGLGLEEDRPDQSGVLVILEGPGVLEDFAVEIEEGKDEVINRMAADLGKPLIVTDTETNEKRTIP